MSLRDHHDQIVRRLGEGDKRTHIAADLGVHHSSLTDYIGRHVTRAPASVGYQENVSSEELLRAERDELRRRLATARKADVGEERILQAIEAAVLSVVPPWQTAAMVPEEGPEPEAHHRQAVLLSDFHGGEVVDRDAVNGLNSYDWEIMEARCDEVVTSLLAYKRRAPALTGLDIAFLGDMCSGSNHAELAETNQYNAAEQGIKMGYLLGQLVERLVPHYPDLKVLGVVGNHPRTSIKPAAKNVWSNFDWIAYKVAENYLRGYVTVDCHFPKAAALVHKIAGLSYYVFHGDGIRSSMPGVPWGGVMRRANTIRANHQVRIDGFWLGHYHQANSMIDLGIHMNGALKGTDEWCQKSGFAASPPRQLLLTFDEKAGRYVGTQSIDPQTGV